MLTTNWYPPSRPPNKYTHTDALARPHPDPRPCPRRMTPSTIPEIRCSIAPASTGEGTVLLHPRRGEARRPSPGRSAGDETRVSALEEAAARTTAERPWTAAAEAAVAAAVGVPEGCCGATSGNGIGGVALPPRTLTVPLGLRTVRPLAAAAVAVTTTTGGAAITRRQAPPPPPPPLLGFRTAPVAWTLTTPLLKISRILRRRHRREAREGPPPPSRRPRRTRSTTTTTLEERVRRRTAVAATAAAAAAALLITGAVAAAAVAATGTVVPIARRRRRRLREQQTTSLHPQLTSVAGVPRVPRRHHRRPRCASPIPTPSRAPAREGVTRGEGMLGGIATRRAGRCQTRGGPERRREGEGSRGRCPCPRDCRGSRRLSLLGRRTPPRSRYVFHAVCVCVCFFFQQSFLCCRYMLCTE